MTTKLLTFLTAWTLFSTSATFAVTLTDNFTYANSAAFEAVYTKSNTAGGDWTAAFNGSQMSVSNSTPATGNFDSFYGRRPIGNVTGNFSATIDLSWLSANEGGERARISIELLKGDATGLHPASAPMNAPWTTANTVASAGIWNDYGVNATSLLIDGHDDPALAPAAFPWQPQIALGASGTADLTIKRLGGILTVSYDGTGATRIYSLSNSDTYTHIGIWYSHYTGLPGQFDGSANYTLDNLVVYTPPAGLQPGDANRDGSVNISDYLLIRANAFEDAPYGPTALGDLNDDEFVDFADFQIWKTSFPGGIAAAEAAIAAVPEPGSLVLALTAAVFLWTSRRRNQR